MRLVLIGAGHVFNLEGALRPLIAAERPSVVALELDPDRLQGLKERRQGRRPTPEDRRRAGRVYRYLADFQASVAESFGVEPGGEMLIAADAAEAAGAKLALIDRDARETVRRAIRQMGVREKMRMLWMGFVSALPRKKKASIEKELERYHKDPAGYLEEVRRQFPTIHRVLIHERNEHMAAALRRLTVEHERVVAVLGDGHIDGIATLLVDLKPVVHRLKDLQAASGSGVEWQPPRGDRVGFSFSGTSLEGHLRGE
ncbi:MAG: TraB/GumN family protein [Euryarchaeota archaeon]|nr:TraB/GumN family protein [Euryarchaeota archaeon]